jgi:RNA polymerase II-associated factor 1
MGVSVMKDSQLRKFSNMTIDEQVEAIEKTFDHVNNAEKIQHVKHPNNPNLTVSQVFPLFPDFELWPNEYILAMYDTDPVQHDGENKNIIAGEEALLQPMANPHNPSERFIAYYAPSDKTIDQITEKRRLKEEHGDDVEFEEVISIPFNH